MDVGGRCVQTACTRQSQPIIMLAYMQCVAPHQGNGTTCSSCTESHRECQEVVTLMMGLPELCPSNNRLAYLNVACLHINNCVHRAGSHASTHTTARIINSTSKQILGKALKVR